MTEQERREAERKACYEDLQALRGEPLPQRAYDLLERMLQRLDRLDVTIEATFPQERPTQPALLRAKERTP